jgi:hypothetical protein
VLLLRGCAQAGGDPLADGHRDQHGDDPELDRGSAAAGRRGQVDETTHPCDDHGGEDVDAQQQRDSEQGSDGVFHVWLPPR